MFDKNLLGAHGDEGLAVLAFKVQARQFDINRGLTYISMKDQIIRGRTLVLAAVRAGLLSAANHSDSEPDVVIFGGGVGGISAALAACELGFSATVIERNPVCFSFLTRGSDRLFSATMYDWPHKHYREHKFPLIDGLRSESAVESFTNNPPAALTFPDKAVTGEELKEHFEAELERYQKRFSEKLKLLTNYSISTLNDVALNSPSGKVWSDVDSTVNKDGVSKKLLKSQIVIFAVGFGLQADLEMTNATLDFFEYKSLHSDIESARKSGLSIEISGAGDGGLQESLRFVLRNEFQDFGAAAELLETRLIRTADSTHWFTLLRRIQAAEDHASKSLMWGYSDLAVFRELDEIYKHSIEELFLHCSETIQQWSNDVSRLEKIKILLLDKREFSKRVYALNRFLILLLTSAPSTGGASITRTLVKTNRSSLAIDSINREGFGSGDMPAVGTSTDEDLLRRAAFRSIPMNLDIVH